MGDDSNPYRQFTNATKAAVQEADQIAKAKSDESTRRLREGFEYAARPLIEVLIPEIEKAKAGTAGDISWEVKDHTSFDNPPLSPSLRGMPSIAIEARGKYPSGRIIVAIKHDDIVHVYAPDSKHVTGRATHKEITELFRGDGHSLSPTVAESIIRRIIDRCFKGGSW